MVNVIFILIQLEKMMRYNKIKFYHKMHIEFTE